MPNDYGVKRLFYPYSYRTLIEQDSTFALVTGDNSNIVQGCNWFILDLTPDEMLKFSSAMLAGLDLLYPDNFIELYEKFWLQPSEFPNSVPDNSCMDICDLVLNCINTDTDIQQAIANYSVGSSINGQTVEVQEILDDQLIANPVGCDSDHIYGMTLQLTQFVNQINEDILELFVNAPFAMARIGDIIEAIPGVGELPFDDMFQFVESFLEDVNDAYQAAYTLSLEIEIACDLFCLAEDNGCILDYQDARDYFYTKLALAIDTTDWLSFVEDIIANNLIGTATVYAMYLVFFQTLIYGGEILGQNFTKVTNLVASMFNDPDSDWSINCDCDPPPDYTFDFTSANSWVLYIGNEGNRGVYTGGIGYEEKWEDQRYRCTIFHDFGFDVDFDKVEADIYWEQAGNTNVLNLRRDTVQSTTLGVQVEAKTISSDGNQTLVYNTPFTALNGNVCLNGAVGTQNVQDGQGEIIIKEVRLWLQ